MVGKNRMTATSQFAGYGSRLRDFMRAALAGRADVGPPPEGDFEGTFSRLACDLFALQFVHNPAYRRLCDARAIRREAICGWRDIPAVPTNAFKEFDLTSLHSAERLAVFHSSGTTEHRPSRHF